MSATRQLSWLNLEIIVPWYRAVLSAMGVAFAIGIVACQTGSQREIVLAPVPQDESDVVVEELASSRYADPSPGGAFCGTDVSSTYSGKSVAHGLTVDSELPSELVDAVEALGWPIDEYEHRWFGERRIVLFSASPSDESKPLFVHAMEIVLIEDEHGERIWSIPERYLARPCG